MKTPREILLARHRAMEPKLDAIRQSVVISMRDRHGASEARGRSSLTAAAILQTLLRELILPSRRVWTGLAAVWLVIVIVNFSQRDYQPAGKVLPLPAMMSFNEQQRLLNELLADHIPAGDTDHPRNSFYGPRSEIFRLQPIDS
jgi:hypothetical protein